MSRYWENQSGYYDPVAKEVIENESKRNKEIHDTIREIKNILDGRNLKLIKRIELQDKLTKKIYK